MRPEPKARVTNMRSEGFFTYSRGAYTNFLHEERKMHRLFFRPQGVQYALYTPCGEKVILSSRGLFKLPHEDKITFSHLYRK